MSYDLKGCISYILHIMHIYISCIMIDVKAYIKLYIYYINNLRKNMYVHSKRNFKDRQ